MKVMQTFKPVKSKTRMEYKKSSFMRKPKLINVLPLYKIHEIKKYLIKKYNFARCTSKIYEEAMCEFKFFFASS